MTLICFKVRNGWGRLTTTRVQVREDADAVEWDEEKELREEGWECGVEEGR